MNLVGRTCCDHAHRGWFEPVVWQHTGEGSFVMPWHLLPLMWLLNFTGSLSSLPNGKRQGLNPFSEYLVKMFSFFL